MVLILLGFTAGIGLPVQTTVNTRLGRRLGSPWNASLVSFSVSLAFLIFLLLVTGQLFALPLSQLRGQPLWLFAGGLCGVTFLTGNILLFPRLGSVQTVAFPVMGQILTGLFVDHFGWLRAEQLSLTPLRGLGAFLVAAGVIVVATARGDGGVLRETSGVLPWQIFAVLAGGLSAAQTAINGALARASGSPIWASVISFAVGVVLLILLHFVLRSRTAEPEVRNSRPWWMWVGGLLGAAYILANIRLSGSFGTGLAIIILLIGSTAGSVLVDHYGLFGAARKPVNLRKAAGLVCMIVGAICIRLL